MNEQQIKEIMALVDELSAAVVWEYIPECRGWYAKARAAIESALRAAVPDEPNPLECLYINRGSADAEADEYAAEYWAQLAQGKADADLRRGALQTVSYYVKDALRRAQAQQDKPAQQWIPINTAPKDGRTLLLGYFNSLNKWRTICGRWMSEEYIEEHWEEPENGSPGWFETAVEPDDVPNCWPTNPTYWMPLPPPADQKD
jgi:hypothetical protein